MNKHFFAKLGIVLAVAITAAFDDFGDRLFPGETVSAFALSALFSVPFWFLIIWLIEGRMDKTSE